MSDGIKKKQNHLEKLFKKNEPINTNNERFFFFKIIRR